MDGGSDGPILSQTAISPSSSNDIPTFTIWEERRVCWCIPTAYVPVIDRHFIGHWEVSLGMPVLVSGLTLASLVTFLAVCLPTFPLREGIGIGAFVLPLGFLFLFSYWRIIVDGPGYFPFYWAYQKRTGIIPPHSDGHCISGIFSTEEQIAFIEVADRPPRSMFSRSARRYVLRPDHLCYWTASWIGKLNHKFFVLFNFYGILYCLLVMIYLFRFALGIYLQKNVTFWAVFFSLFIVAGVFFVGLTGRFLANALINGVSNRTNWEIWNQYDMAAMDAGSPCANLEDFMGRVPKWQWMCPVSPWKDMTEDQMLEGYVTYDELERSFPVV
jgi:hypothetical protein